MRRLLAMAALALLAAPALADPVLERVDADVSKKRRLTIKVEARLEGRGELRIEGDVNGRTFRKRKRVRRGGATRFRVRIDAKRLRIRKLDEPLVFSLRAIAEEKDGSRVERAVDRSVPVPVVFLPGLGNDGPGGEGGLGDIASLAFLAALDAGAGGAYQTGGDDPTLVVHPYASLTESLSASAKGLKKRVRRMLRGTSFACVDVVGYSMGGLVARRWAADHGRGKVRRMVFLATPNEGAPLAQLIGIGLESDLLGSLGGDLVPGLGDLSGVLELLVAGDGTGDVLRTFYPTYPWLFVTLDIPFIGGRLPVTQELIDNFGSFVPGIDGLALDFSSPLTALNAVGPDDHATYHAIGYSALLTEGLGIELGTVDEVDVTGLISGETIDPLALASGEGDGLVPWRSLVMADTPAWFGAIDATDLGAGTHVTLLVDPACIARVVELLAE